jgi:hypothetical protein
VYNTLGCAPADLADEVRELPLPLDFEALAAIERLEALRRQSAQQGQLFLVLSCLALEQVQPRAQDLARILKPTNGDLFLHELIVVIGEIDVPSRHGHTPLETTP